MNFDFSLGFQRLFHFDLSLGFMQIDPQLTIKLSISSIFTPELIQFCPNSLTSFI
jgi:hypothetical protein